MSNYNPVNRDIPVTEEMQELVNISRVRFNSKKNKLYLYNGKDKPVELDLPVEAYNRPQTICKVLVKMLGVSEEVATKWAGHLGDSWINSEGQPENGRQEKQTILQTYKYTGTSSDIPTLYESVLVEDEAKFLRIVDGSADLSDEVTLPGSTTLRPMDKLSYLSKEYSFSSEEEINSYIERAKKETHSSLYYKFKSQWQKYIDADDFHIVICSANTFFSYFQDRIGTTHYLLFVGDVNVGKTNNLTVFQQLVYRPLCDTSITPANIYRFYGPFEKGQGTILEDEIDDIEYQPEKMKLYKAGYEGNKKVTRNDDTPSGRKSQGFYVFGFKAFTSEKQPDSVKCKGLNERIFVLKCYAGDPIYDISEVVDPAGDEGHERLLNEFVDLRKLAFIYRMIHYNDPIPNVKLNIKNRDKQLCKPLLRLFKGTPAEQESLSRLLEEKKNRKSNTVDAKLYDVITKLIEQQDKDLAQKLDKKQDKVFLRSTTSAKCEVEGRSIQIKSIWDAFIDAVDGQPIHNKLLSTSTVDYGPVSQKDIAGVLKDKFGADPSDDPEDHNKRGFVFSRTKLGKLKQNYSRFEKIEIIDESGGTLGALGASIGCKENFGKNKSVETRDNVSDIDKNIQENDINIKDSTSKNFPEISQHSYNVPNPPNPPEASNGPSVNNCSSDDKESLTSEGPSKLPDMPELPKSIISVEDFFSNDKPLPQGHTMEQSPCYPVIGSKPGEIPTDTVYYCKLHPDMIPSHFIQTIENHCRDKEPDIHKAEILSETGGTT